MVGIHHLYGAQCNYNAVNVGVKINYPLKQIQPVVGILRVSSLNALINRALIVID